MEGFYCGFLKVQQIITLRKLRQQRFLQYEETSRHWIENKAIIIKVRVGLTLTALSSSNTSAVFVGTCFQTYERIKCKNSQR